jgi:hypothetical protein
VVAVVVTLTFLVYLDLDSHHRKQEDIVVLVVLSHMAVTAAVYIVAAVVDMVTGDMDKPVDTVVVPGIELHQDMEALDRVVLVSGEDQAVHMVGEAVVHRAVYNIEIVMVQFLDKVFMLLWDTEEPREEAVIVGMDILERYMLIFVHMMLQHHQSVLVPLHTD